MENTLTRFPGDDGQPIPKFNERLEKDIGNIIGINTNSYDLENGRVVHIIDKGILLYEILEYITQNYENTNN